MNLKTVDFLDVRFDLVNNTYQPYRKPNNELVYIHKQSNHSPNILKELPKSINNRQISDISCDEHVCNNTKETYEKALESNGFTEKLTYNQMNKIKITEKQKRKEKGKVYGSTPFLFECQNQCWKVIL